MPETITDTLPLTAFRDNPTEPLDQLRTTRRPITLTVDGKPAAILQDPAEYQRLRNLAAAASAEEGIRQGLEELHRGEGRPAQEFFEEFREKYGLSR